MKKTCVAISFLVLIFSISLKVKAQEKAPKYQVYNISDDLVKPSMKSEYEEGLKDYISIFSENNYPYPIYVYSTRDFHYYYVTPIGLKFSELDSLYKYFNQAIKASPEKWESVWKKFEGTYEYNINKIIVLNRELSYYPENPRLQSEEEKFHYWVFTYVKVGKTKEFIELIKKWKELHQQKNITDGYSVYFGDMGTEQPLYIWHMTAKDLADFWTQDKIIYEALGDEAKELWLETSKLIRKIERKEGWFRKNLSYFLEEKE